MQKMCDIINMGYFNQNNRRGGIINTFTVSFFGHRHLSDQFAIENRLEPILRDIIQSKEFVEFLIGRDGDFDQLVSSTIRRCKEKYSSGNVSHILVLP